MYRARVDKISGTKIFAGGKWLQCIGNKPVRVGEYIWTDGRCVYGNFQESQQPLVITAPDDEAIPIVLRDDNWEYFFYTYKNTLKFVDGPISLNQNSFSRQKLYNVINGYKGKVYSGSWITGNEFMNFYQILATNVDRSGNIYSIQRPKYAYY